MKKLKSNKIIMAGMSLALALVMSVGVLGVTKTNASAGGFFDYFDRISISKCSVKFDNNSFEWTGEPIMPQVAVNYEGKTLVENTDYELSFYNNINAGEGRVIVKGINDFRGSDTYSFVIKGVDISKKCEVKKDFCQCEKIFMSVEEYENSKDNYMSSYNYDICRELNVYFDGKLLDEDDYKVSILHVNDRPINKVGNIQKYSRTVTYKITGKGKYQGKTFFDYKYNIKVNEKQ